MKDDAGRRASDDCGHNAAKGTLVPRERTGVIGNPDSSSGGVCDGKLTANDVTECRTFDEKSSC
jgi:hypothetical protein